VAEKADVLVVGAGPAGSTAARVAAEAGAQVVLIDKRLVVGLPVQCAEYVPAQIVGYVTPPERCIAQRIRTLHTHLPDGEVVETPAAGYVLDRASFDKALAVAASRAGAEIWTTARAMERTERGVLVRRGGKDLEIECRVIIGADGPSSTVGRWIEQANAAFIAAMQAEVILPEPQESTQVYFDPAYRGGYGWLFPKGETTNVGVGVNRRMGGDPKEALAHLLEKLEISSSAIVGRTGGLVPSGGSVAQLRVGNVLLVGDAAGHTHPITGAGIFSAVVSGELAGKAASRAVKVNDLAPLDDYETEWAPFMGGPLQHALNKRRHLDEHWSEDPAALCSVVRECWVAFRAYGRRGKRREG
jgi:geranylgeranyl reductase family protein